MTGGSLKVRGREKTLIYKSAIKYMYKLGEVGQRADGLLFKGMGGLAQAVADGRAESFGGRQRTQNDGAALGVERAQAGVEVARQLLGRGPAAPREGGYGRQSFDLLRFGEFGGKHEAEAFV